MGVFLRRLIAAASKGEAADFTEELVEYQQGQRQEPPTLDGKEVRRLLLGRRDRSDPIGFAPAECFRWEIRGATIKGHLDLRDARLPSGSPLPALEFQGCTFEEGFCADGAHLERLCLRDCKFGTPSAEPEAAQISLRGVRVESELRLCGVQPVIPEGLVRVDANAAHVGANCVVENSTLRAPANRDNETPLETPYALNLRNAVVRADLLLQPDVTLHGGLVAVGVHVGGSLVAIGLSSTDGADETFRKASQKAGKPLRNAIALHAASIEGNLWLGISQADKVVEVTGGITMYGSRIGGFLNCDRFRLNQALEVDISRLDWSLVDLTAKNLYFWNTEVNGTLSLQGATVQGSWQVWDCTFRSFIATGIAVEGDSYINSKIYGEINLDGATLNGKLDLTGLRFPFLSDKLKFSPGGAPNPKLQMKDTDIKRALVLGRIRGKGDVTFLEARVHEPLCYRRVKIVEVKAKLSIKDEPLPDFKKQSDDETFWVSFLVRGGARPVILNGRSEPFHDMNRRGLLKVDTEQQREDYVRLFCAYLRGENEGKESTFRVLEKAEQICGAKSDNNTTIPTIRKLELKETKEGSGTFGTTTHMSYHSYVFETKLELRLAKPVTIEMLDDTPKLELDPKQQSQYRNPFKFGANADHSDYEVTWVPLSKERLERLAPLWKDAFRTNDVNFENAEVDLTDASCGTLFDLDGAAWGDGVRLHLHNFTYTRIEPNSDASRETVGFWWEIAVRGLLWLSSVHSGLSESLERQPVRRLTLVAAKSFFYGWQIKLRRAVGLSTRMRSQRSRGQVATWFENLVESGISATGVEQRLRWLEQRAKAKAHEEPEPFTQQPYAHLAKVLREQGDEADARKIEERGIQIERWSRAKRSFSGKMALPWWGLYRFFFRYGLAPFRAVRTFLCFILMGWVGAVYASNHHLLVLTSTPVKVEGTSGSDPGTRSTAGLKVHEEAAGDGSLWGLLLRWGEQATQEGKGEEGGFSDRANGFLYVTELAVPFLHLQESRYDVRANTAKDDAAWNDALRDMHGQGIKAHVAGLWKVTWSLPWVWRVSKWLYAVVGWVVTSLTILTLAGTLRKWEVK